IQGEDESKVTQNRESKSSSSHQTLFLRSVSVSLRMFSASFYTLAVVSTSARFSQSKILLLPRLTRSHPQILEHESTGQHQCNTLMGYCRIRVEKSLLQR